MKAKEKRRLEQEKNLFRINDKVRITKEALQKQSPDPSMVRVYGRIVGFQGSWPQVIWPYKPHEVRLLDPAELEPVERKSADG